MLALFFMFHNFVRIHNTLKVSSGMAVGVENRLGGGWPILFGSLMNKKAIIRRHDILIKNLLTIAGLIMI